MIACDPPCNLAQPRPWRRRLTLLITASFVTLAPWVMGCSQNKEAFTKQFDRLRVDIAQLRADNLTLQDRIAVLEDDERDQERREAPKARAKDRPELKVIRLSPEAATTPESAGIAPETVDGQATAAANDEPALDLKLDGEDKPSKTYRYHRSQRPPTRSALKR